MLLVSAGGARAAEIASGLIEVTAKNGGFFDEQQIDEHLGRAGFRNYLKLIVVTDRIYHVIGMSRGGRFNYVENGLIFNVDVAQGRWFESWEEDAIVVGRIAAETMSDAETPPGMRHYYNLGSIVHLGTGHIPSRVIGLLDIESAGYTGKIFGNLWRVQSAYSRRGQISSVLIGVDTNDEDVKARNVAQLVGQALIVTYTKKSPKSERQRWLEEMGTARDCFVLMAKHPTG